MHQNRIQTFLRSYGSTGWGTKEQLISKLMQRGGLRFEQCAFVEDDPEEIRRAKDVCRTLFVKDAHGMTSEHCAILLRMGVEPCSTIAVQKNPQNHSGFKTLARAGSHASSALWRHPSGKPWKARTSVV